MLRRERWELNQLAVGIFQLMLFPASPPSLTWKQITLQRKRKNFKNITTKGDTKWKMMWWRLRLVKWDESHQTKRTVDVVSPSATTAITSLPTPSNYLLPPPPPSLLVERRQMASASNQDKNRQVRPNTHNTLHIHTHTHTRIYRNTL